MVATTVNNISIPPIYYEEEEKIDIRSISEIFPEYTSCNIGDFKNSLIDVIFNIYSRDNKNTVQYGTNFSFFSGIAMPKYYKSISEVKISDYLYKFEFNFIYSITKEEECIIAENEFFNIFGYGQTIEEAENELFEYINVLWEAYVEENDENLDQSAIVLKKKILKSIRKL